MAVAEDSIMGQAIQFVGSKINSLDDTAARYSATLQASLAQLANITVHDVPAPLRMGVPETPAPVFNLSNPPTFNPVTLRMPQAPGALDIEALLANLDVGNLDGIPDPPPLIPVHLPDAPSMPRLDAPTRPVIDTTVTLPDAPDAAMPVMEDLHAITLPAFEFPQLPDFNGNPPTLDFAAPDVFIDWVEPAYQSEVLDDLVAKVKTMMAGGTGLPPAVEDALFARARERDSAETERAVQEAVDTWAGRNFSMPPGMLAKQVNVVREQGRLKAAETNRDVLVEAAKWEIENIRFAVTQGMALEQLTANLYENTCKRLFEVAKFQAESKISIFNAQIGLFNAQNQAFEMTVQVFRTRLEAALSKLTAYKTAIDGQVALGQINQQKVEVFKARLQAVASAVEIFKAKMQGAQVKADTIKTQFEAYKADVQAFAEQIGAEKVKFDAYEAQVRAETAKAGMYDSQARAYATTVQAMANKVDIKVKGAQLRMDAARTKVQKFLADVDAYKANLDSSLREVQYSTQVYQSQVEGWKATASANVAAADVQARFADTRTRTGIAFAEMQMHEYQAKMQNAVQQAQIALEAAKAMGQFSAQLAAGAMSAMHVSASVSGSGSASSSDSRSTSTSTSHNYSY